MPQWWKQGFNSDSTDLTQQSSVWGFFVFSPRKVGHGVLCPLLQQPFLHQSSALRHPLEEPRADHGCIRLLSAGRPHVFRHIFDLNVIIFFP